MDWDADDDADMLCVADMLCAEPEEAADAVDPSCGFPEQAEINGSSMAIRTIYAVQCICLLVMFSSSSVNMKSNCKRMGGAAPAKSGDRAFM